MGCDIHGHIEVELNGKWEHYNTLNIGRDYILFGVLSGVRSSETPLFHTLPTIPNNCSEITKKEYEYWENDAHSITVLSAQDFNKLVRHLKTNYPRLYDDSYFEREFMRVTSVEYSIYAQAWLDEGLYEDMRYIFWYDN